MPPETEIEQIESPQTDETADQQTGQESDADQVSEDTGSRSKADLQRISKVNRENASLRRRLKEIEDRDKTDAQKAAEAAAETSKRAERAERELLRISIAAEQGLSVADSRRLNGETEEELRADAIAYAEERQVTAPGRAATRKPTEVLRGGSTPNEPVEELDPVKLAEQIRSAR